MFIVSQFEVPPGVAIPVPNRVLIEEILGEDIVVTNHVFNRFPCNWHLLPLATVLMQVVYSAHLSQDFIVRKVAFSSHQLTYEANSAVC